MVMEVGEPRELGTDESRLRFTEPKQRDDQPGLPGRQLWLDEQPAFDLSYWCGTCPLLFERLGGANEKLTLPALQDQLNSGLEHIVPAVVEAFAVLLPRGIYQPLLLEVAPRLVQPAGRGDYFYEEQPRIWGIDPFWGLPHYTRTPYYRTFERCLGPEERLFEFVVPMVPPSWNDPERVEHYREGLVASSRPIAVAVSILDIAQPAIEQGPEYGAHWGLMHFLLDGHHKLQAAAETARKVLVLALLATESGMSSPDQVAAAVAARTSAA